MTESPDCLFAHRVSRMAWNHMSLGADGLIHLGFFTELVRKVGGILNRETGKNAI